MEQRITLKDYAMRFGQTKTAKDAKECALEGMARTQVMWLKEGIIKA